MPVWVPVELLSPATDLVPIMLHEAFVEHAATFPSRRDQYGKDTQMKWDAAARLTAEALAAARGELPRWRERVDTATGGIDLYVSPTLARPIPELTVWEPDVRVAMVGNTRTFSFRGWPAIAIGNLQLAGPEAATVLAAALAWEDLAAPISVGVPG